MFSTHRHIPSVATFHSDSGRLADVGDTGRSIVALYLLGRAVDSTRLIEDFETEYYFASLRSSKMNL